jgi:hypothetical protein
MPELRPRVEASDIARHLSRSGIALGAGAVAIAGLCWALFSGWLAHRGHAPSHAALGIAPERFYALQAVFVIPLLELQWLLCAAITVRMLRAFGVRAAWTITANALAFALALPLVGMVLVPDLVVYAVLGFESLGKLVRWTAPLCMLGAIMTATLLLQKVHPVTTTRAAVAATLGVIGQALLGGVFLR